MWVRKTWNRPQQSVFNLKFVVENFELVFHLKILQDGERVKKLEEIRKDFCENKNRKQTIELSTKWKKCNVVQTKTKPNLLWCYDNTNALRRPQQNETHAHIWPNLCCIHNLSLQLVFSTLLLSLILRHSEIESINLNQILR